MSVVVREGRQQVTRKTKRSMRVVRGYASSRVAYDRRRRLDPPDEEARRYQAIVREDPCSYCRSGRCGQMAADHIVAANAGGLNVWDNYTAAGRPCNAAKKDKPLLHFLLEVRDAVAR